MKKSIPIAFVDDDKDDVNTIKKSFEKLNQTDSLETFSGGQDFLDYLDGIKENEFPSLVVLDYNMPFLNGGQVLSYLKTNPRYCDIPVLIYTTSATSQVKKEVLDKGAIFCIEKGNSIAAIREQAEYFHELVR